MRNTRRVEPIPHLTRRVRIVISGAVQGVGFRPFVYRLATELELSGWVLNSSEGLVIEAEGDGRTLEIFLRRLEKERPLNSIIRKMDWSYLAPAGFKTFEIRHSDERGKKNVQVLPDLVICPECLKEIFDPRNRRHLYPFTNCTSCGPRFSIIEALPYDRANTTMRQFKMCEACQREYDDPANRRFHAQPNACHDCGPHLELWDKHGNPMGSKEGALFKAARAIEKGSIVALKGLGGFHLIVDARNDDAVRELRRRKHREGKPFAVMFPNLESVGEECDVSETEKKLLLSPTSPIVLLKRKGKSEFSRLSFLVAPENPFLGVMIPTTPLHALLLDELNFPIVTTSGNLSEEPICIDEKEAVERLRDIADLFLIHNRPIVRAMDDSVLRVVIGRPLLLRGGRGYAPLVIQLEKEIPQVLAVGGHLKNTIAVSGGNSVIVSQHMGDLDSEPSYKAFLKAEESLKTLYEIDPKAVGRDLHPDYFSSQYAERLKVPCVEVQHHHAHIVSCMADNGVSGEVLGIAWDGSGYGLDGTIWGGEFLLATRENFKRVGSFRPFRLPGGEKAIREPRRSALGLLYEIFGAGLFDEPDLPLLEAFSGSELRTLQSMLEKQVNAPLTSSVGRLFDAVASILNLKQKSSFEGQAAMALEFAADNRQAEPYPILINRRKEGLLEVDWEPLMLNILMDVKGGFTVGAISSRFHATLVEIIVDVTESLDEKRVVLSGGCFQNGFLLEQAVRRLKEKGIEVYWPRLVPPNDGGLSLGQAVVAASQLEALRSAAADSRQGKL